jgi:hypothetical protein
VAYVKTNWVNGVTPENAANLNHIEQGIADNDAAATAAAAAVAAKAELIYKGDWAAGTYHDGDVVVKDGIAFLCVGGDTAVAPDGTLWGSLGPTIPAVVNGKWLKGSGGAMVWADLTEGPNYALNASGANVDVPLGDLAAAIHYLNLTVGGGSIRSFQAAAAPAGYGQIIQIRNGSGASVTLRNNLAGAPGGYLPLYLDAPGDVVLPSGYHATFSSYAGSFWLLIGITGAIAPPVAIVTALPASPVEGQEVILTDSLTVPTYNWRLKFTGNISDAYKWVFIGGTPKLVTIATAEAVSGSGFVDPATVGPSFTLPRAGDYEIELQTSCYASQGGLASGMSYADAAAASLSRWNGLVVNGTIANMRTNLYGKFRSLAQAQGQVVTAKYRCHDSGSFSTTFMDRQLRVTPVRVS